MSHPRTRSRAGLLTNPALSPYPGRVTNTARFYGYFYYGFPSAGRDWRRTRE
jgi:hypothetical protein